MDWLASVFSGRGECDVARGKEFPQNWCEKGFASAAAAENCQTSMGTDVMPQGSDVSHFF
jgi:hypothetical protein